LPHSICRYGKTIDSPFKLNIFTVAADSENGMNIKHKSEINIANEKIGVGMIAASLCVILLAVGVFFYQQKNADINAIQRQGVSLSRLLGSMSIAQLTSEKSGVGALRLFKETQLNQYFAYASIVGVDGVALTELTAPNISVPPMFMPQQPSQWNASRVYQSNNGEKIFEYCSPIMDKGNLKAFIRLGYTEPTYSLNASQVRLLAILAMAIFLLAPIFYFIIQREIKPLSSIGAKLQALIKKTDVIDSSAAIDTSIDISTNKNTQDFMKKFNTVVEAAYNHIDTLEEKQTNSVVSCKLLDYQRARLESAFNALPCAVLVADESGQVTYASNKIHSLLGTREGETLGCNLSDLSQNREISEYLVRCQASNAASMCHQDPADIFLPETDKRVTVNPYPLYSHKNKKQQLGMVIVFQDITNDDAERSNNSEFIAHVAHELKTPLNILYMYSETLLDNADASRELTIEAANVIHDETGRISQMIDNLLNLAMIEMGTVSMQRQRVKMADFLQDIYQTMSHNKQDESLDFNLNMPHDLGVLSIDKELVRISINNLVGNAMKYNRPGGKVELIAEENDTEMFITVRDTGIGISESDQHRIFSKFFRSEDEEVRKRTGHGLGLSLVHETAKLHQGDIHINSTPGEGSEFVMRFTKDSNLLKDAI